MSKYVFSCFFLCWLIFSCAPSVERNPLSLNPIIQLLESQTPKKNSSKVANPIFSPSASSPYNTPVYISITTSTAGASIYYTLDGTTPNSNSTLYQTPLHIWTVAGIPIKAIAVYPGMIDSDVVTIVYSYLPLKTGLNVSYYTNDDFAVNSGIARSYYVDNADGTVSDKATGLVWQKCSRGQSPPSCSGTATLHNWDDSKTYCQNLNLASKTWRLPTLEELLTLRDYGRSTDPAIDTSFFPATISGISYWTSNESLGSAYLINFMASSLIHQIVFSEYKTYNKPVRCVSGPSRLYVGNFVDYGNGTVKDLATGLIWQKCSSGQNNDSTCSGSASYSNNWTQALDYCTNLNLASLSWRLPNINELFSLNLITILSPSLFSSSFPNTPYDYFMSSTSLKSNPSKFFVTYGYWTGVSSKTISYSGYRVRCVAGP